MPRVRIDDLPFEARLSTTEQQGLFGGVWRGGKWYPFGGPDVMPGYGVPILPLAPKTSVWMAFDTGRNSALFLRRPVR